jgi:predicted deacylase
MIRRICFWLVVLLVLVSGLVGGWAGAVPLPQAAAQQAPSLVREFTIGFSGQDRPITAVQVGSGERKLVVVGDTHGGPEANTYWLTRQLIDHFRANPAEVPPEVRLYLIPTLNPDGLALGSRFDAYQVDLNRNMNTSHDACPENDWRKTVYGAYGRISNTGGPYPDSQRESRVLRGFLLDASGAIFLHSNAGLVFPPFCEHAPSLAMAQAYAQAAGYRYTRYWERYMITGGMHDWAGGLGIAAITPELLSATSSEFAQNLAGLRAVLAQPSDLLPLPQDGFENGIPVPALIWRYWRAHGGAEVFGVPLAPAHSTPDGIAQTFSRARLRLRPALADTAFLVQPAPLGYLRMAARGTPVPAVPQVPTTERYPAPPQPPGATQITFETSGHTLSAGFLAYWRRNGGLDVFGYPLSEEITERTSDGQRRTVQYFERALLAYDTASGSVRPEPLGWQILHMEQVRTPWVAPQVR